MMIKRYDPKVGGYQGIEFFGMQESENGKWIRHDDYEAEKKENFVKIKNVVSIDGWHDAKKELPEKIDSFVVMHIKNKATGGMFFATGFLDEKGSSIDQNFNEILAWAMLVPPCFQENLKPCPFCGSTDIDAEGVLKNDGKKSPCCMNCGATAETVFGWNSRSL